MRFVALALHSCLCLGFPACAGPCVTDLPSTSPAAGTLCADFVDCFAFCRAPRNQTAWRPVLAMLQLMQELVPLLGVISSGAGGRSSSTDSSSGGFDLQVRHHTRGGPCCCFFALHAHSCWSKASLHSPIMLQSWLMCAVSSPCLQHMRACRACVVFYTPNPNPFAHWEMSTFTCLCRS